MSAVQWVGIAVTITAGLTLIAILLHHWESAGEEKAVSMPHGSYESRGVGE